MFRSLYVHVGETKKIREGENYGALQSSFYHESSESVGSTLLQETQKLTQSRHLIQRIDGG